MNHLANEKSPYLIQHQDNPVDWYPWSEEAFQIAKEEDKPVFLSIGYSTCHWCHVMAHESFMNPEVADLMNDTFINIKVDREERPDVDQIYMNVCQMLTGNGGWPLTIIMAADKKPFFAATYIPRNGKNGSGGMLEIIPIISDIWQSDRSLFLENSEKILTQLQNTVNLETNTQNGIAGSNEIQRWIKNAYESLLSIFDKENGGFGYRPKFPSPHNILFLLRFHYRYPENSKALAISEKTLLKMRAGGIYDHIGLGFHRYSTDEKWFIPHFEKMLYDQAMHTLAYSNAFYETGKTAYKQVSEEIMEYVLREMTSPEAGFYCAEDADSDGKEGRYYLWTFQQIYESLNSDELSFLLKYYSVELNGNYFVEASEKPTGENIIYIPDYNNLEFILGNNKSDSFALLLKIRKIIFSERSKRIHPLKDDKILTDWNGLMIAAMAKAAIISNDPIFLETSKKAANFIWENLLNSEITFHRYRDRESAVHANLDDYAFFIMGLICLYQADQNIKWLQKALTLNKIMIETFYDGINGGFFFVSENLHSTGELIVRPKDAYDGAIPCGNSVALHNLVLLKKYTGSVEWDDVLQKTISYFAPNIKRNPAGYTFFLLALDLYTHPGLEIIINGAADEPEIKEAVYYLKNSNMPDMVFHQRNSGNNRELAKLASFTSEMGDPSKKSFYVCRNFTCQRPVYNLQDFLKILVHKRPD